MTYYGYGPTVIDGVVQYLSPSGIEKSNALSPWGCPTRWWYEYIDERKGPFTAAAKLGVDTHKYIEGFLKAHRTDSKTPLLNSLAYHARHFIPYPDSSYLVEHRIQEVNYINVNEFDSWAHAPLLTAAGVRIVGEVDLLQPHNGEKCTYINELGDICPDAPYTVQVTDWKTTTNISRNAKNAHSLVNTVQMPLYAMYALARYPDAKNVRISHVYMQTQGAQKSKKVTVLLSRERVIAEWSRIEDMVRKILIWAKMSEPSRIPKKKSCGRCPHTSYCEREQLKTLGDCFDSAQLPKNVKTENTVTKGKNMDILKQLSTLGQEQAPEDAPRETQWPDNFDKVIGTVRSMRKAGKPVGLPRMEADVAKAYHAMTGEGTPEAFAGEGPLSELKSALSFEQIYGLTEYDFVPMSEASEAPAPEAPAPEAPTPEAPTPEAPTPEAPTPEAPTPEAPTPEAPTPEARVDSAETPTLAEFKKLKKPDMVIAFDRLSRTPSPAGMMSDDVAYEKGLAEGKAKQSSEFSEGMSKLTVVHINCVPSQPFDRLDGYVSDILRKLEDKCGAKDIRTSKHELLGFGAWKGAIGAMVRESPPEPGQYVIWSDTEIMQEFAEALKGVADLYVQGGA